MNPKNQFESENLDDELIKGEILQMYEADQAMRERAINNDGVIESDEDINLDRINTQKMKEIIERSGWPSISRFGKDTAKRAWLLVQHADHDIDFQECCLGLMKSLSVEEVDVTDIAYLEDRIRVNRGRPQLYGTQFYEKNKGDPSSYGPRQIEDLDRVDERRKSVGLESLEEYKQRLLKKYYKE